ncbi:MAG: TrkA family potassium uptake protein [Clostridium sp.]|nr:TrkA family potassium uptake protein [Clostridium sp.]
MKNVLIIGLGKFGHQLCKQMVEYGNQVMAIDMKEEVLEDVKSIVTSTHIADCTNEDVIKSIGVQNFDLCFVCIGSNFQNSLVITDLLYSNNAKCIISKANRSVQAKFLKSAGASEVIYVDEEVAKRLTIKFTRDDIFEYRELNDEYSMYEISVYKDWIGKSIREINVRAKHNLNVIGIKKGESTHYSFSPDHIFTEDEHLFVIATKKDMDKLSKR